MEPGGATLQDGPHELYIYKCEDRSKLDSLSYLSLPSSGREPNAIGNNFLTNFQSYKNLFFSKIKKEDRNFIFFFLYFDLGSFKIAINKKLNE